MINLSRLRKLGLIIAAALVMGIGAPQGAWGGLKEGLDAYKRKDYAAAYKELRPFAEKGDVVAQKNLGFMYHNGLGVRKDHRLALKWFRKSAEQGNERAQHNLGVMYHKGEGVPKDYKLAVKWYRKSAEQGFAVAQYSLGIMYLKGSGVPQGYVLVHMWWNISGANGHENAINSKSLLEKEMTPPANYECKTSRKRVVEKT